MHITHVYNVSQKNDTLTLLMQLTELYLYGGDCGEIQSCDK